MTVLIVDAYSANDTALSKYGKTLICFLDIIQRV
jgi:hypothetical protein